MLEDFRFCGHGKEDKRFCEEPQRFSASCCSLDHHDPVLCIADNGILLFLNSTDNVFKLNLSASSKLCFQNIIINFNVAFKFINKLSPADLILPFRAYLPFKTP